MKGYKTMCGSNQSASIRCEDRGGNVEYTAGGSGYGWGSGREEQRGFWGRRWVFDPASCRHTPMSVPYQRPCWKLEYWHRLRASGLCGGGRDLGARKFRVDDTN
jgi:hypothetical protein